MPDVCAACNSGRNGSNYAGSYFSIPTESTRPELHAKWVKAAPILDWKPAKTAKLCELNFGIEDFKSKREDSNVTRKRKDGDGDLKIKRLKDNVVPHIWPGCPSYLSKHAPKRRSDSTSADVREEKENNMQLKALQVARENDKVSSTEEIKQKLASHSIPTNLIETLDSEGNLLFLSVSTRPFPKIEFGSRAGQRD